MKIYFLNIDKQKIKNKVINAIYYTFWEEEKFNQYRD